MKQALVVDGSGAVGDFAASTLREREYELTVVRSLQEALALVTLAPYHLIVIAQPALCPQVLWRMVESIRRRSTDATLILVQAENADGSFHTQAQRLGAIVLSTPLDVAARAAIEEATLG
jgi:CheY-like chemotaxis protein